MTGYKDGSALLAFRRRYGLLRHVGTSASLEWTIALLRARDDDSWVNHFMLALIVTTALLACLGFVLAHA
jgi:hypothetical protein